MEIKKTILVDLDGVLNTYSGNYTNYIPDMKYGADYFLFELCKIFKVVVYTTRNPQQTLYWLKNNNLDKYISHVTNCKEPACLTIDDRCITFDGNYHNMLYKIKNFKVWYK